MIRTKLIFIAAALAVVASPAVAAKKRTAVPKTVATQQSAATSSAEAEAGKACKAEADAKGLHEEPRKIFRKACMRAALGKPAPIKSADGAARPAAAEQR